MIQLRVGGMRRKPGKFLTTNPNLANIFGHMDLDFDNFNFQDVLDSGNFRISRFPDSEILKILPGIGHLLPSQTFPSLASDTANFSVFWPGPDLTGDLM